MQKIKRILAFLAFLAITLLLFSSAPSNSQSVPPLRGIELDDRERVVNLTGIISSESTPVVLAQIFDVAMTGRKGPVLLVINSPGGYVDSSMEIINAIKSSENPFYCIAANQAASMAAIILSYCQYRFAMRNSHIIFHEVRAMISQMVPISIIFSSMAVSMAETMKLYGEVAKNLSMTQEQFWNRISEGKEWTMDGKQALESGIVHGVVLGFERAHDGHLVIRYTSDVKSLQ